MTMHPSDTSPGEAMTPNTFRATMDNAAPAFRMTDVRFGYADAPVLRDVRLDIAAGSFTGVIGPNGAGKTTLLRLLTGMRTPDAGEVRCMDRRIESIPPRQRARLMALVPQFEETVFAFPVRDMVLMGRAPHVRGWGFERAEDDEAAERAMRLAGVLDLAGRSVTDLSGGELHRVLIARALAQDTPILLLDEPNAHLDLRHQVALFELLRALHAEGRSIVCVTHDLNLAARYCERLLLLADGGIAADGAPLDVLTPERIHEHFGVRADVRADALGAQVRVLGLA